MFSIFKRDKKEKVSEIEELKKTTEDLKLVANDLRKTQDKMEASLNKLNEDRELHV